MNINNGIVFAVNSTEKQVLGSDNYNIFTFFLKIKLVPIIRPL